VASKLKRAPRKVRRDGRSAGEPRHVRHYLWMLDSPAYRSLSCPARCLLVELYALHNGVNNGELYLSVREAARRLGVGNTTAWRAFGELEAKGFIRARQRGSFDWKAGLATCWILTEFGFAGALPSKDFMHLGQGENLMPVPLAKPNGPSGETAPGVTGLEKGATVPQAKPRRPKTAQQRFHDRHTDSLPGEGAGKPEVPRVSTLGTSANDSSDILIFRRGSRIGARFFAGEWNKGRSGASWNGDSQSS